MGLGGPMLARATACAFAIALLLTVGGGLETVFASNGPDARSPSGRLSLIQQGQKLTGGGAAGAGRFGTSVALSADGDTALVGGPDDDGLRGAVWTFTRSGTTWSQQGGKLTGGGETGNGRFGTSVALSPDGKTALVGGHEDA